ncbi:helix-turn-helix domain-containing protein [Phytoactinopolyspora halotolerans]|uniref:Helix-turn-helix transcriptional regulator n=1 Tax=Phytoactinopolyspora halotolerans TaxID=1981512 RepID=A0A6L9SHU4_9ACTN|nr:helix-turn-helix transcriptional regulator [Phytoactinopolyspora halotolerans]NEE04769.1 helix-turn-helix transcriptional regulator [Phytoactinopolyspora halotolerans]
MSGRLNDDFRARLGAKLRATRQFRQLTLQEVERRTGGDVKYTVLGSYERADRSPSIERLLQLARVYDVDITDLLPDADRERKAVQSSECPYCHQPIYVVLLAAEPTGDHGEVNL